MSDVVDLLQRLIRLDTTNPPGNETLAATLLRDYLEAAGLECEFHARVPERANLVARLRGGDGPMLALLSHTDVVLADATEWDREPFSGELVDGEVWGRGALDMKGQVAASAVALASLAREGVRPAGDVVFVAAADEEVGAGFGLSWLVEEHPDSVRADFSLNEGGGDCLRIGGRNVWLCATAEKMSAPFRLRVHGRSGHASMPSIADNALLKAAAMVETLGFHEAQPRLEPEVERLLRTVADDVPADPGELVAFAHAIDPLLGDLVSPLVALTLAPTMIEASKKRNVIPALCDVVVDSRLLPGQTPVEQLELVRTLLARIRKASSRRSASPGSPTRTGCGTRSGRSRTGSSRRGCRSRSRRC